MSTPARRAQGAEVRAFIARSSDQSKPGNMSLAALLASTHVSNDPVVGLLESIGLDAAILTAACNSEELPGGTLAMFALSIRHKADAAIELYYRLEAANDEGGSDGA